MRSIHIMARALAAEFGATLRALDEAQVTVRRRPLGDHTRGLFLPVTDGRVLPCLLLARGVTAPERDRLMMLALGHHFLRHRAQPWYPYLDTGPGFTDDRARLEAALFADAFARALPPPRRLTLVR